MHEITPSILDILRIIRNSILLHNLPRISRFPPQTTSLDISGGPRPPPPTLRRRRLLS
jgi:hypothetical protein